MTNKFDDIQDHVFSVARKLSNNSMMAKDLAQEVNYKLYKFYAHKTYEELIKLTYSVCRSIICDTNKKMPVRTFRILEVDSISDSLHKNLIDKEYRDHIYEMLYNQYKDPHITWIIKMLEGYKISELSKNVGVDENNLRQIKFKAKNFILSNINYPH